MKEKVNLFKSNERTISMEELYKLITNYIPENEQEENDKRIMLKYINEFDDVLTRKNELFH